MCDCGARCNHAVRAQFVAAHHGGVGADGRPVADPRLADRPLGVECSWDQIVGQRGGGTEKHVITDVDARIDTDVILDLATIADGRAGIHEDVLAQDAVASNSGTAPDVTVVPHPSSVSDFGTFLHDG